VSRDDGRDEKGCFVEGNEIGKDTRLAPGHAGGPGGPVGNQKNMAAGGVAGAIKDLAAGQPLHGDLATIQHRYAEQVATHQGRVDAQRWLAGAFFAIVEGLLAVVQQAIANDERDKAVAYIQHFGTFGSKAGAELSRLEDLAKQQVGPNVIDAAIAEAERVLSDADRTTD